MAKFRDKSFYVFGYLIGKSLHEVFDALLGKFRCPVAYSPSTLSHT